MWALPRSQDGDMRGQCGNDLQCVFVPFSVVFVQQARFTTAPFGQVFDSTSAVCLVPWHLSFTDCAPAAPAHSKLAPITAATAVCRNQPCFVVRVMVSFSPHSSRP
jgi:hypothetical protein